MTVGDAMQPLTVSLSGRVLPDTLLRDVARLIREDGMRYVPVTQNGRIIGLITARDLVSVSPDKISNGVARARQVMRRSVVRAYPDESLYTAWVRMSRNNLRQLVVVNREQGSQMVGVLTAEAIATLLRAPATSQIQGHSMRHGQSSQLRAGSPGGASTRAGETAVGGESPDASLRRLARANVGQDPFARQRVADAMSAAPEMIPATTPLTRVREVLQERRVILVSERKGTLWGILKAADVHGRANMADGRELTAGEVAIQNVITAQPDEPLRAAVRRMVRLGLQQLPVVSGRRLVGLLRRSDVLAAYWQTQATDEDDAGTQDAAKAMSREQPS
jgi:CBS domain-containing protein